MSLLLRCPHPPHTWQRHVIGTGDTVKARNRFGLAVTLKVRSWSSPEATEPFVTGSTRNGNLRTVRVSDIVRVTPAVSR